MNFHAPPTRRLAEGRRLIAGAMVGLSQSWMLGLPQGRGNPALPIALRRPKIASASVLAGLQLLLATHGLEGRQLGSGALLPALQPEGAELGSPAMLLSAVDLAWTRLADEDRTIELAGLNHLAGLSSLASEKDLDPAFIEEIVSAANDLCHRVSLATRREWPAMEDFTPQATGIPEPVGMPASLSGI